MKTRGIHCEVKTCFLCRHSLPEWLPAIAAGRKNISIRKGETLFKEGETMTNIYFVNQGAVKVHKHWGDEKELILRFARSGDILGHRGLGKATVYPVSATAITPALLCYVDLDFFRSSLKVNHDFLYKLMLFYAEELKTSERRMNNLAHMQVKGRVAGALLDLEKDFGVDGKGFITLTLSRQDLAAYAGTAYETLFRILNELEKEQAVRLQGKSIACISREKLLRHTLEARQ